MKKIFWLLLPAAILVAGCGVKNNTLKNPENQKNVATQLAPALTSEKLDIDSPRTGQKITSPVKVSGNSNFFEANTLIRIKDEKGGILAATFATAQGWMDKKYPFSAPVSYRKPASEKGIIEVYDLSPKDGKETNKLSVPVVFSDLDKNWALYSADFENAINTQSYPDIKKLLAPKVNLVFEATECCGLISGDAALKKAQDYIVKMYDPAKSFNFFQEQATVKSIQAKSGDKEQADYFKNYILGIGNNAGGTVVGYRLDKNGKISDWYISVASDLLTR
ncbi:MAG: Gmad2 immunoglobulin-like domain-containing protein [Candidatus Moranbacteria bacterium]|nr:Gmad2 immunoglobulin-like domain-containing protein [Candidatus Moranbacteria bacterium]